jgi:AraC-like DNA-binding protein
MAISIRQLQRDFHSILGISLNEYRIILRFYVAAHGLKNGSIADVAHEAGYYDQSHMSREFKKRSGWTPRQVSMHHYYEHK